ncbi:MAG: amidotransferase 1, exosortase A system-associated [Alphaproteobacteria bacterium]
MCGLAGQFDTKGLRPIDPRAVAVMTDAIAHRGPDGDGFHTAPGVCLGHRRLAIIDLTTGDQPIYNEDRSVAVIQNGEIYNYRELMAELQALGHTFRTVSDTEVMVHAWEEWGADFVERLRGMFAIALHDANKQCLFLARDRLGKKPLYYTELPDGRLAFASELKALLVLPDLPRRIDPRAVEDYMAYGYVPDPRSIYRDVAKLPPATTLTVTSGRPVPAPVTYWSVRFDPRARGEAEAAAELAERLRVAVDIRRVSDVPIGAFLSGGVDSSAVVALMAQQSTDPVNTFSIGFDNPKFDESEYAARHAARYHTNHFTRIVAAEEFDLIDRLASIYDEPFGDSSAMPTYRVSAVARENVTVALSGDGGDEVLAGYRRYPWHVNEERVRHLLPAALRGPVFGALGRLYPKLDWAPRPLRAKTTLQELALDAVGGFFVSVSAMTDAHRDQIYSSGFKRELAGYHACEVLRGAMEEADTDVPLLQAQYADLKTWLPGRMMVKVDRASMAASLETRAPLLDHEFVEWAATLPADMKLRGREGKYLLKKAMEPHIEADILYRPKMGFSIPLADWFRGPLADRIRAVAASPALADSGIFEPAAVARLVDEHQSGRWDHATGLWNLLMFDGFLRQVHDTGKSALADQQVRAAG